MATLHFFQEYKAGLTFAIILCNLSHYQNKEHVHDYLNRCKKVLDRINLYL